MRQPVDIDCVCKAILGVDEYFRAKLTETRKRMAPMQIGKAGQGGHYRIASAEPREVKVRIHGETKAMKSEKL